MDTLSQYSLLSESQEIECRPLIPAGENDHVLPIEQAREFAAEIGEHTTLYLAVVSPFSSWLLEPACSIASENLPQESTLDGVSTVTLAAQSP